jgi:cathepsin L
MYQSRDGLHSEEGAPSAGANRDEEWKLFKLKFNKVYESTADEESHRMTFLKTLEDIELHNFKESLGLTSYRKGVNKFSDMDELEMRRMKGFKGDRSPLLTNGATYLPPNVAMDLPDTVDWRDKGYVTPVKNQGGCGSCWAFSSTGALEGQIKRKTGKLISFSEQNLVDCTVSYGNEGCGGGWMDVSYLYIDLNDGLDTESAYPYKGKDGNCTYDESKSGGTDLGYYRLQTGNETLLKIAVASSGPIAVAIDASPFGSYVSGVLDYPDCSTINLDHAVLIVGYGTDKASGLEYWLVKNSWGVEWGMKGYVMMSRNKKNQCGIATHAMLPVV